MPPGRKPTDKTIRIAKTLTGSKPTPINGPITRREQNEAQLKQLSERLAAIRAATPKGK